MCRRLKPCPEHGLRYQLRREGRRVHKARCKRDLILPTTRQACTAQLVVRARLPIKPGGRRLLMIAEMSATHRVLRRCGFTSDHEALLVTNLCQISSASVISQRTAHVPATAPKVLAWLHSSSTARINSRGSVSKVGGGGDSASSISPLLVLCCLVRCCCPSNARSVLTMRIHCTAVRALVLGSGQ